MDDTEAKLKFLQSASTYGQNGLSVECVETHMSWVFLVGTRVFKLKKPVYFSFLDFRTLAAREHFCREEVRLNARLAPGTYLGVLAIQSDGGEFFLVPDAQRSAHAQTVDWLVCMRRLPPRTALLQAVVQNRVGATEIDLLSQRLAAFYRSVAVVAVDETEYAGRFQLAQASNREVLLQLRLIPVNAARAIDRLEGVLQQGADLLHRRAQDHRVRDGHGDLRPEHVFLLAPPIVIDCLEFNPQLRQVDPFDEIAYLGLECAMAGADWIGPRMVSNIAALLNDHPVAALIHLYTAHRSMLRARLAVAHLLDPRPRTPDKWMPLAQRYIERALQACDAFTACLRHGNR